MLIGYARVSTQDQNLDLRREALKHAGCEKIFEDQISAVRAERPGLTRTLELVRAGDVLVVWKIASDEASKTLFISLGSWPSAVFTSRA